MRRLLPYFLCVVLLLTKSLVAQPSEPLFEASDSYQDSVKAIHYYLTEIRMTEEMDTVIDRLQHLEYELAAFDNDTLQALLYEKFGAVYRRLGELDLAFEYYQKALNGYGKLGRKRDVAQILFMQSQVYLISFEFDKAMDVCLQSLKIYDELGDKAGQAKVYVQIGITYDYQEQYEEALNYYHRSLDLYAELGNKKGLSNANNNIGIIHDIQGDYDKALAFYGKSLALDTEIGDVHGVAGSKANIGLIYQEKEMFTESEKYYLEALALYSEVKDKFGIGVCYVNLASLYRVMGKYDLALKSVKKSIALSKETNDMKQNIDGYREMVGIYRDIGQFEKALEAQTTLMSIKDSLFNARKKSEILELQQKYEAQKKEQAINQLNRENALNQLAISQKTNQQIILFGSLGVMVLVAVFFFYQQMRGKKVNEKLSGFNDELERINEEVHTKNRAITDSIQYARQIQKALLPEPSLVNEMLPQSFVMYRPKDIVSGDFYWADEVDGKVVFAAVDCTGHGVPGALMSIVGFNGLNKALSDAQHITAGELLTLLNTEVLAALHRQNQHEQIKDGMDLGLCVWDKQAGKLHYAGAKNPLYRVRNGELKQVKPDKKSIAEEPDFTFTNHELDIMSGDTVYIFTDGFSDQFGGIAGRKLNYPAFRKLMAETSSMPMNEQRDHLIRFFDTWRGTEEQVDDVCVIGVRFS